MSLPTGVVHVEDHQAGNFQADRLVQLVPKYMDFFAAQKKKNDQGHLAFSTEADARKFLEDEQHKLFSTPDRSGQKVLIWYPTKNDHDSAFFHFAFPVKAQGGEFTYAAKLNGKNGVYAYKSLQDLTQHVATEFNIDGHKFIEMGVCE